MEDIINKIMSFGYTEKGAKTIIKKHEYYKLNINNFLNNYDDFKNCAMKYDFDDLDVRTMLLLNPRIVVYSDRFKDRYKKIKKYLAGTRTDAVIVSIIVVFTPEKIKEKIKIFKDKKFTVNDIKKMLNNDPQAITRSKKSFDDMFDSLVKMGFKNKYAIKIYATLSKGLFKKDGKVKQNIEKLFSYGFSPKEIEGIVKNINGLSDGERIDDVFKLFRDFGLSDEEIKDAIVNHNKIIKYDEEGYSGIVKTLEDKDFTDEEIKIVTLRAKEIVSYSSNKIDKIYEVFYHYNLNDKNIKDVVLGNPKVLYHKYQKIIDILDTFIKNDIVGEKMINIVCSYPNIFENSLENLDKKLKLINRFNLLEVIEWNPKNLIQGPEKTLLRCLYIQYIMEWSFDTLEVKKMVFRPKTYVELIDNNLDETGKEISEVDILKMIFTDYEVIPPIINKKIKFNNRLKNKNHL